MNNIGRIIKDDYCNGYGDYDYGLADSSIEQEAYDYIILRREDRQPVFIRFGEDDDKQELIDKWCDINSI